MSLCLFPSIPLLRFCGQICILYLYLHPPLLKSFSYFHAQGKDSKNWMGCLEDDIVDRKLKYIWSWCIPRLGWHSRRRQWPIWHSDCLLRWRTRRVGSRRPWHHRWHIQKCHQVPRILQACHFHRVSSIFFEDKVFLILFFGSFFFLLKFLDECLLETDTATRTCPPFSSWVRFTNLLGVSPVTHRQARSLDRKTASIKRLAQW